MPDAPVKLCECGCGKPTPISRYTDRRRGVKKGQPLRYLPGHHTQPDQGQNRKRVEACADRREQVRELYEAGRSYTSIAERLGIDRAIVNSDVRWHRARGTLGYRNTERAADPKVVAEIESMWRDERLCAREIGERLGWSKAQTQGVIGTLRRRGVDLPRRPGRPVAVDSGERARLKRQIKKRASTSGEPISDGTKLVLRLLTVGHRPMGASELHHFVEVCGEAVSRQVVRSRLERLEKRGLVARVEPEVRRWFERRNRWFVPLDAQQPSESLTLADAERETELAALIESQQDELKRGDWIDSEKGHWADKSIDAPLTADGFTILDTLGEEDESLQELMEAA